MVNGIRNPIGIFIKDTHLSKNTVDINKYIFKQCIKQCIKYNVPLFHAGDIFSSRNAQPLEMLSSFRDILNDLEDSKVTLHVIHGNHDLVDQESDVSYISVYDKHPYIKLYSNEESVEFGNVVIHFLPYFKESGSYYSRLQSLTPVSHKKNLCLTHVAVTGVKNNDGSIVENCLKKDIFDKFDLTMIGHYHDESWIDDKIWYFPGSYQSNFGEDNIKGCILLYDDLSYDFIKLDFPEFIKVKINIDNNHIINDMIDKYKDSSDNIRFVLHGDEVMLASFDKSILTDIGIDVKFDTNILITESNNESVIYDNLNIKDAFNDFCNVNKYENDEIGSKYLGLIL